MSADAPEKKTRKLQKEKSDAAARKLIEKCVFPYTDTLCWALQIMTFIYDTETEIEARATPFAVAAVYEGERADCECDGQIKRIECHTRDWNIVFTILSSFCFVLVVLILQCPLVMHILPALDIERDSRLPPICNNSAVMQHLLCNLTAIKVFSFSHCNINYHRPPVSSNKHSIPYCSSFSFQSRTDDVVVLLTAGGGLKVDSKSVGNCFDIVVVRPLVSPRNNPHCVRFVGGFVNIYMYIHIKPSFFSSLHPFVDKS